MINRPWIKQYDKEVPPHLKYLECKIQDFLINQTERFPDRIALICEEQQITYRKLVNRSRIFSEKLLEMGIEPGNRVAICLPNTIEFVISYYGTLMAGGIVAAMNPYYPLYEWNSQVKIVKPLVLIGLQSRFDDLRELQSQNKISQLILVTSIGSDENQQKHQKESDYFYYSDLMGEENQGNKVVEFSPDQPAMLQFSGGTTGIPKAALVLHRNVVANVLQFTQWLTTLQEGKEVFLTVIPLYHVYGMVIGLNVGIAMGATIVLVPDGRDLENILNLIQKNKVSFFPGVPSIYNGINNNPKVLAGEISLRSIKACISGSAPLLPEIRTRFESLTGGKLVEGYGLSEAPTATHCNPLKGENRSGSIGLPLPDVDCKIIDLENDTRELPVGEVGELVIRSPQIMQGYYQSSVETEIALKGGWLHTGDIASMDEDGYFYIIGRRKELIKVNGLQVWPVEVEEVLIKFPGVLEVAAAGIPDDETGEAVKAWLVFDHQNKFDLETFLLFCRRYLAGYKVPKAVEIINALPKTPVGKVLRRELVRMHLEKRKQSRA